MAKHIQTAILAIMFIIGIMLVVAGKWLLLVTTMIPMWLCYVMTKKIASE